MSRIIQWNAAVYMISAALLASLLFASNVSIHEWNKSSADKSFPQWQIKKQSLAPALLTGPTLPTMPKSSFQPVTAIPESSSITAPAAPSVPSIHSDSVPVPPSVQVPASAQVPVTAQVPSSVQAGVTGPASVSDQAGASPAAQSVPGTNPVYQVTAYYLNVRAMPNADSDIIRSLKQGTAIHVRQATDNGWLALEGGGYVHGRYAVPWPEADKAVAPSTDAAQKKGVVKIASAATSVSASKAGAVAKTAAISAAVSDRGGDPLKPTSKIKSSSGLTKAHIAALLEGTKLQGYGLEDVILGVEEEYGINAFFTIAVMKLESGNGKSTLSRTKNNLFGLNAVTGNAHKKAFSFKSKGDSIRKFGQLINDNYVERGLTTVEKIGRKYCPANRLWAGHVQKIMRSDFGKLA